jgi:hypothetical protein
VKYSELKGTVTFQGTATNPAVVYQLQGQGRPPRRHEAEQVIYYIKDKTFESIHARGVGQ